MNQFLYAQWMGFSTSSLPILKQTAVFLITTQPGRVILGVNFIYGLIFGLCMLMAGLLIFGPAMLLMQGQHVFSWIVLPFLSLIFLILMGALTFSVQYIVFVILNRAEKNLSPLINWEILEKEKHRFHLYLECLGRAALEIVVGLVMLIYPGVILFLKYSLIGPVIVSGSQSDGTYKNILNASAKTSASQYQEIGIIFLGALMIYLLFKFLFGIFISQLIIGPLLLFIVTVYLYRLVRL